MKKRWCVVFAFSLTATWGLLLSRSVGAVEYDYLGMRIPFTPFDSHYERVQRYVESKVSSGDLDFQEFRGSDAVAHLDVLRRYLKIASRFEYIPDGNDGTGTANGLKLDSHKREGSLNEYWQLPEETEDRGAGDCEDKSIWLYTRLIQVGFENVRLVVGRYRTDKASYHAWVVCYLDGKIYILDPTMNDGLWEARQYPKGFYRPVYSFSRDRRWHHGDAYRQRLTPASQRPID